MSGPKPADRAQLDISAHPDPPAPTLGSVSLQKLFPQQKVYSTSLSKSLDRPLPHNPINEELVIYSDSSEEGAQFLMNSLMQAEFGLF